MINHSFFAAIHVMIFTCITMKITRGIGQNKNGPIMGRIFFFEELPIPPEATKSWIFAVVAKNSLPCLEVYSLILTSPPKKYTMTLFLDPTLMSPCHSLPSEDFASFGVIRYHLPIFVLLRVLGV